MNYRNNYRNRVQEIERLIKVLKGVGIVNVEELSKVLVRIMQSYAVQIGIEPLRPRELEYVWQRLIE